MSDITFRSPQQESKAEEQAPTVKKGVSASTPSSVSDSIEVPYLDYRQNNGQPFSVSFFNLGDNWNDPSGGFGEEVGVIEDYFRERIESGDLANSVNAVKNELKSYEKVIGVKNEERTVLRVGKIAAYIKFLSETKDIDKYLRKYGNTK